MFTLIVKKTLCFSFISKKPHVIEMSKANRLCIRRTCLRLQNNTGFLAMNSLTNSVLECWLINNTNAGVNKC